MPIDEELLKILVCPQCKGKVVLEGDYLLCHNCRKKYPIRDDIPIMLVDEAVPFDGDTTFQQE